MLKLKIIPPSQSEWGSPCILVHKLPEQGKLQPPRFVVDYRRLNSVTQGDGYPIPSISGVLGAVSQGKVFANCDLVSGYWQIPIRQSDQHKTAFCTHYVTGIPTIISYNEEGLTLEMLLSIYLHTWDFMNFSDFLFD